jgi:hypothetical protein
LLIALGGQAGATTWTVQQMHGYCKRAEKAASGATVTRAEDSEATLCLGYINALSDLLLFNCAFEMKMRQLGMERDIAPLMADTDGVSSEVLIRTLVLWADQNPDRWDDLASIGGAVALGQRFPCQE